MIPSRKRGIRKCILVGLVIIFVAAFICNKTELVLTSTDLLRQPSTKIQRVRKLGVPPQLTDIEEESLSQFSSEDKEALTERLSEIVQSQLKTIQTAENCSEPNFQCGHIQGCGFGCQVHHRVACLMISYALNLPLIHNEKQAWPFSNKWRDVFEPFGTGCRPGKNTFQWIWKRNVTSLYRDATNSATNLPNKIKYPLHDGLPVSKKLGDLVEKINPNPFLWFVGQFMKYALKPNQKFQEKIDLQKKSIGFANPIIGFHVRRTDKVTEARDSHHEINEYVEAAGDLLSKYSKGGVADFDIQNLPRRLFIASDESKVLPEAQKKYPDWKVIGFESNRTLKNLAQRKNSLDDIVRDVLILSECDYIVCGLTSNICRLVLEIFSWKHFDSMQRISSLDGKYKYVVVGGNNPRLTIVKVDPSY